MKRSSARAIFLGTALLAGTASAAVAPWESIQAPRTSSEDVQAPRSAGEDIQAPRTRSEDIQAPRTGSDALARLAQGLEPRLPARFVGTRARMKRGPTRVAIIRIFGPDRI
jgi:hypothetical protein